jgi:hypothetical protein
MAIDKGNKLEFGHFLAVGFQQIIRQNAADAVNSYNTLRTEGQDTAAVNTLKRALDMPNRLRARFGAWQSQYNSRNGAGSANVLAAECIGLFNQGKAAADQTTLGEVNTKLANMENWAAQIVTQSPPPYGDGSLTWDDIAGQLHLQVDYVPTIMSRLPFPTDYVDIWGE